jgi:hypothetical protein
VTAEMVFSGKGWQEDGDLNIFLNANGIHIDKHKETLMDINFKSLKPEVEDPFEITVF